MINSSSVTLETLLTYAQQQDFTKKGEIFNVDYLYDIAHNYLKMNTHVLHNWDTQNVVNVLSQGGCLVVPYDKDVYKK